MSEWNPLAGPIPGTVMQADYDRVVTYAEQLKARALFVVGILECEGWPKVAEQLRQAVEGEKCVPWCDCKGPWCEGRDRDDGARMTCCHSDE